MIDWFTNLALLAAGGYEKLAAMFVSMAPLVELKGGIPIGVKLGLSYHESFLWALLGSSLVVVPVFLFCKLFYFAAAKNKKFAKATEKLDAVFRRRAVKIIDKSNNAENEKTSRRHVNFIKAMYILIFVAIPILMTGVWMGALSAVLINLPFRFTLPAIIIGNVITGGLILFLTWVFGAYIDLFILILFISIVLLLCISVLRFFIRKRNVK